MIIKSKPIKPQTFKADEPEPDNPDSNAFTAVSRARDYLKSNGYTIGSMCRDEPIGFAPAEEYGCIAKWYSLSPSDRDKLTGILKSNDFRNGDVELVLLKPKKG